MADEGTMKKNRNTNTIKAIATTLKTVFASSGITSSNSSAKTFAVPFSSNNIPNEKEVPKSRKTSQSKSRPLKNYRLFHFYVSRKSKGFRFWRNSKTGSLFELKQGLYYPMSFNILFRFTVNMAIAPCICMPVRPEDDATSYPCLCFNSLFLASIL